jgi:glycine betaine/proline transport system permease protein
MVVTDRKTEIAAWSWERLSARAPVVWVGIALVTALCLMLQPFVSWLAAVPVELTIPLARWTKTAAAAFTDQFKGVFRAGTWLLAFPLGWLRLLMDWLPWSTVVLLVAALGQLAGGRRLAWLAAGSLLYVVIIGYWQPTTYTVALAGVAVPISVFVGLLLGIAVHRSQGVRRIVDPMLDLMQTVPTFAYLIPMLVLFGIGPVVGMAAAAIYAVPPMVRSVALGLDRVPAEIVEAGTMAGSNDWQLLFWVKLPAALAMILVGINQTIMAALSMIVIAAMVGGANDMGLEVFTTMKRAAFGESMLAGLVIVLLAIVMDRVSRGFADNSRNFGADDAAWLKRKKVAVMLAVAAGLLGVLAQFAPPLDRYPDAWTFYPADYLNRALSWFTVTFFPLTSALKTLFLVYLLLPLRIGLVQAMQPALWGFTMSPGIILVYCSLAAMVCGFAYRGFGWPAALGVLFGFTLYFYGTNGLPWPAFLLIVSALAFQVGGMRVGILAALGLSFIIVTGSWANAMISLQLCGAGVACSFALGTSLGIWASVNERVSAFLRPINDTLQTMPIFVFLIPAIMVFLVGEFTALIAIVVYATVPSIRFTEHGLRNVPEAAAEAARACGATNWQLLWQVKLPLALPEIMLGLNQTIMMALAMVVVAALVGAKGLGQDIMIALNEADPGAGIVSGLCVAFIAITADRIIQSWVQRKRAALADEKGP